MINGHLGDAYWPPGRMREAEFQWRRALNLKPEPEDAREARRRSCRRSTRPAPAQAAVRRQYAALAERLTEEAPRQGQPVPARAGPAAGRVSSAGQPRGVPGRGDVLRAEPGRRADAELEGPFAAGLARTDNLVLRAARALAAAAGRDRRGAAGAGEAAAGRVRDRRRLGGRGGGPAAAVPVVGAGAAAGEAERDRARAGRGRAGVSGRASPRGWAGSARCSARRRCCRRAGWCWSIRGCRSRRRRCSGRGTAASRSRAAAAALGGRGGDGGGPRATAQRPRGAGGPALPGGRRGARRGCGRSPGCLLARMSGSGATCFGLFADASAAAEAAPLGARAGWWSRGGPLRAGPLSTYSVRAIGASPSGKAADFESAIRRFESFRPNQFTSARLQALTPAARGRAGNTNPGAAWGLSRNADQPAGERRAGYSSVRSR